MKKKRGSIRLYSLVLAQIFLLISITLVSSIFLSGFVIAPDPANVVPKTPIANPDPPVGGAGATTAKTTPAGSINTEHIGTSVGSGTSGNLYAVGNLKGTYQGSKVTELSELKSAGDGTYTATVTTEKGVSTGQILTDADLKGMGVSLTDTPYASQGYTGANLGFGTFFKASPVWGSLVSGLMYATVAYGIVAMIGSLAGLDDGLTKSLEYSAVGGIMAGKLAYGLSIKAGHGVLGMTAGQTGLVTGIVAAALIFVLTYKTTTKDKVDFQCLPYEAPIQGKYCDLCNNNPLQPCSEYRCKALGQACQILNAGTAAEQCAWVGRNDVKSATIQPDRSVLYPTDLKLDYIPFESSRRPPAIGVKVVAKSNGNGCLPAFTPLRFGFTTDKPAQCKIDFNHTATFDDMSYFVGDSNFFEKNHTQTMILPGVSTQGTQIQNGQTSSLFVRCKDANGNVNIDEYVFDFCVDDSPDVTPPTIQGYSVPSGGYISYGQDNLSLDVYVNEPATCKWSTQSVEYNQMENNMTCAMDTYEINSNSYYVCSTLLTGIQNRADNNFFFRCKDQPFAENDSARNVNIQSTPYTIKGSQPLDILSVAPNETISGSTDVVPATLTVVTGNGAQGDGNASCLFSSDNQSFITMLNTNSFIHTQPLNLVNGAYSYTFHCVDAGGNSATANTNFSILVDKFPPQITRAYKDQALKIVTDEDATCVYSTTTCNYAMKDIPPTNNFIYAKADVKTQLFAEWKENAIYYIKCKDSYNNEPEPSKCSAIIRAVDISNVKK